jgi:hypothetical protein
MAGKGISNDKSSQEAINWFAEQSHQESDPGAMLPSHGASLFVTTPNAGIVRGMLYNPEDQLLYVVSGNKLYEITELAVATERGTLVSSLGLVQMALNAFSDEILIVDSNKGYIFETDTNTFTQIADANFPDPGPGTCAYKDGYFLVGDPNNTGRFRWSALNDGLTWPATNFATVESIESRVAQILTDKTNIYIWGQNRGEIWYNSGDPDLIFQRFEFLNSGTLSAHLDGARTCQLLGNTLAWIQQNKRGQLQAVIAGTQYQPTIISTPELERSWKSFNIGSVSTYAMQIDGHEFFVVSFSGGSGATYVYDLSTELWHQRSSTFSSGNPTRELANTYAFCERWGSGGGVNLGIHLAGDYQANGKIYEFRRDLYTWDGVVMERRITGPQIKVDNKARVSFSEIQIETNREATTGNIIVSWSKDGGQTYSSGRTFALSEPRLVARKPGYARSWVFRVYTNSTDKVLIKNSYARFVDEPLTGYQRQAEWPRRFYQI